MTDLATQIEQAKPAEQWEMLVAAWEHIYGAPAVQSERGLIYHRLLAVNTEEAFTGAALMLVLEGWEWELEAQETELHYPVYSKWTYIAKFGSLPDILSATPALAIAAACVRAHDAKEDGT